MKSASVKHQINIFARSSVVLAATVSLLSMAGCTGVTPAAAPARSTIQGADAGSAVTHRAQIDAARVEADIARARTLVSQIENAPRPAFNGFAIKAASSSNEIACGDSGCWVRLQGGKALVYTEGQWVDSGADPATLLTIRGGSGEQTITVDALDAPGVWNGLVVVGQSMDDRITVNNTSGTFGRGRIQVNGGAGNDILTVTGTTAAYLFGDSGHDIINGTDGADTIHGDSGDDMIMGNGGDDYIDGDANDDCIVGNAGNDTIYGGPGNDYVGGNDGDDHIYGGPGHGVTGNPDDRDHETLDGGAGNDYIEGGPQNDIIHGNDGNDTIYGSQGDDYVTGDAGDDVIYGGNGQGDGICGGTFNESGTCVASGEDTMAGGKPNGQGNLELPPWPGTPGADPNNTNNGTPADDNGNGDGNGNFVGVHVHV